MKKILIVLTLLSGLFPARSQVLPALGPAAMPEQIAPVEAPFDIQVARPRFAPRSVTVKMSRKGLSTTAIQKAIDRLAVQGGGTVVIPGGVWTTGRLVLRSGVCLHLSEGVELHFSGDIKDYLPAVPTRNEGIDMMSLGAMIYAFEAENIGVTGKGTIFGPSTECEIYKANEATAGNDQVNIDVPASERIFDGQQGRGVYLPMMIAPFRCKSVLIEGITIKEGLFWNIVPQYCDNVIIRGVTVRSHGHGRTDGIDIESTSNALVEYCSLDCGDDCYTMKSGRGLDGLRAGVPTKNVVVRYCEALRGAGGIVFGTETAGDIFNVYTHDCRFEGTDQAFRFKTRRPRGGGAHHIWIERVVAQGLGGPAFYCDMLGSARWVGELASRLPAREVGALTPSFHDIHISDVSVETKGWLFNLCGLPEMPLRDFTVERLNGSARDFLRLQDVHGFTLRDAAIRCEVLSEHLDGCEGILLEDIIF